MVSASTTTITIRLRPQDVARVDEMRGSVSRSGYVRQLLRTSGPVEEIPTRLESLQLLAESARSGKVAAQVALARELRDGANHSIMDWIMRGDG
jgi:hypothetical protein